MPKTETVNHSGPAIRAHRKARGLTVTRLAAIVGSTPQTISNVERHNKRCSAVLFQRIAEALEVSEGELRGGAPAPEPILLTVAEAAAELGCSESHVRRLIDGGEIRYVDIAHGGSRVKARIRRDDLIRFVEARTQAPIPA